jgi:PPM family protein phosphatase
MFQNKIEAWLSRPALDRALNQCFDLSAVLATDIGLQRTENQDRVAALRINAESASGRPLIAVAVADGMGGCGMAQSAPLWLCRVSSML